jgi:glycosyltransferase involved in cell wall biosynthesis
MPTVSICIPVFKQPDLLEKLLQSILKQTYKDYEIIVCDDTPDDSIKNLLKAFDLGDKLRYQHNKPALGSPRNWNEAMRLAQGQYIKIMHHDDWFLTDNALAQMVQTLQQNPEVGALFAASKHYRTDNAMYLRQNKLTKAHCEQLSKNPEELMTNNSLGTPSVLMHKNIRHWQYDEQMQWLVDVDFYAMLFKNTQVCFVETPLIGIGHGAYRVTDVVFEKADLMLFEYGYFAKKWQIDLSKAPYYGFMGSLLARLRVESVAQIENGMAHFEARWKPLFEEWIANREVFVRQNKKSALIQKWVLLKRRLRHFLMYN